MKKAYCSIFTTLILCLTINVFCQDLEIFVSDGGNFNSPPWQILKFDGDGGNPEVFTNQNLGWPQDIVFLAGQGIVLISNLNTGRITKYDSANGDYLGNFATGIGGPTRMKIGPDGLLYVLQWQGNGRVKRYQLDGTFVDDFTSIGVNQSIGLAWDANNNLYVSSFGGNFVRQFDTNGNNVGLFLTAGDLQGATNIWFNAAGELLVCNWNGTTVRRFDSAGNFIDDFITGLSMSEGVSIFPNGNILIGNGGTKSVKLFDPNGNFIEDIIPSGTANLLLPNAIAIRRALPVSIKEVEKTAFFIKPTIGTVFFLDPLFIQKVKAVEIYNILGKVMVQKEVNDAQIWDGSNYPKGTYFIKAKLTSGELYTQKVVLVK